MNCVEVIIADSNAQSAELTIRTLSSRSGIKISGIALDGEQAYIMIKKFNPKLVVLEPNMTKIDGFNLIKMVEYDCEICPKPKFIILTDMIDFPVMENAFNYGVCCVMLKSADRNILLSRIESMFNFEKTEEADELSVSQLLISLGISARLKGHHYIAEAIKMAANDNAVLYGITKNLYPEIARKYSTTSAGVERAIRNAIEISWSKGSNDKKKYIFGNTIDPKKGRPTNYEMIAQLTQWLRLKRNETKPVF